MKQYFPPNAAIIETAATTKKRNIFIIILIFIALYLISSLASSLIAIMPLTLYFVFSSGTHASASTSVSDWMNIISLFITAVPIIVILIYCCKIEKRRIITLGFVKKGAFVEYVAGLGIGLLMFTAAYAIILVSGESKFTGFNPEVSFGMVFLFFLGFLIQGASEEIMLRSYFFVSGAANSNVIVSLIVSSGFFAALHLLNPGISPLAIVNLFLFGVFAALYFLRRGSIWGICAIHSIWNFAQGNIFGCEVSGMGMENSLILTAKQSGTLWSGGAFGPEGGIGVTIVLTAGILILTFMKNKHIDGFILQKEPESSQA